MTFNTYFDNAATSFPKPAAVSREISRYLNVVGGPYGRSAYERAFQVSREVEAARERMAGVIGAGHSEKVIFTPNATQALNMVIRGLDLENRHVLISPLEHNAVTRPLFSMKQAGRTGFDVLPHGSDGRVRTDQIKSRIKKNTALVVVNHLSNVNGTVQPVREIKEAVGTIPLLVEGAQSAGSQPIHVDEWAVDFLAFTGHKSLLGPTGIGGLFIRDPEGLPPLVYGGTGSRSEAFDMPSVPPDKFEAGTHNIAGLFGLLGALKEPPAARHTRSDLQALIEKIKALKHLVFHGAGDFSFQGPVFSITHTRHDCAEMGRALFDRYKIEARVGLHCAPLAHQSLGTFPEGTLRIAPSKVHTPSDFDYLLKALLEIDGL